MHSTGLAAFIKIIISVFHFLYSYLTNDIGFTAVPRLDIPLGLESDAETLDIINVYMRPEE